MGSLSRKFESKNLYKKAFQLKPLGYTQELAGVKRTALTFALIMALFFSVVSEIAFVKLVMARTITVPDDYPTIQAAIGNATDGDTIFVKKGTYEGPINQTFIIDKQLSLIGESTESTVLSLHPKYTLTRTSTYDYYTYPDDAITINADDVKLVNFTIFLMGTFRVDGDRVQIANNNITSKSPNTILQTEELFIDGSYCNITRNVGLERISLENSSDNTFMQNSFDSLYLISTDRNFFDSNRFQHVKLSGANDNIFSNNNISSKEWEYAVYLANSSDNVFNDNRVEVDQWLGNTNLKLLLESRNNTFYGNTFIGEAELVVTDASVYGNF